MEFDTGARLKAEREARRLSQRQLAQAAGVTGSMISMIEQNRTSPSIATLKKILAALDISLGAFFASDEPQQPSWFFRHDDLREIVPRARTGGGTTSGTTSGSGGGAAPLPEVSFRQVGRPGASPLQMLHERYPPGADTGPELYSHDAEEAGIVIAGEITVTVGEETRRLRAGDAYLFNSRIAHRFRNTGDTDCIIVSACTPPTF